MGKRMVAVCEVGEIVEKGLSEVGLRTEDVVLSPAAIALAMLEKREEAEEAKEKKEKEKKKEKKFAGEKKMNKKEKYEKVKQEIKKKYLEFHMKLQKIMEDERILKLINKLEERLQEKDKIISMQERKILQLNEKSNSEERR